MFSLVLGPSIEEVYDIFQGINGKYGIREKQSHRVLVRTVFDLIEYGDKEYGYNMFVLHKDGYIALCRDSDLEHLEVV